MNGNEILAKAKQSSLRAVEVPEWEVTLYVRRASFAKMMKLSQNVQGLEGNQVTFNTDDVVDTIIEYTCDKDGNAVFTEQHKTDLADADFGVISKLYRAIVNSQGSVEESEKN